MKKLIVLFSVLSVLLGALLGAASARGSGAGSIVVGEVFAAGGNSGAPYANDYVELVNRGSGAVSVGGWTLQYASATGTTWQTTALAGSIPAGGRYLVQLASGGLNGAALPTPDAAGTLNLAMTGGKVAVVDDGSTTEDLVGWGNATDFEGSGPAPALTSTTALVRAGGGCTDADDNASDFADASPNPQNSSAAGISCSGSGSAGGDQSGAVDLDLEPVLSVGLDRDTLSFGAALPGTTPAPLAEHVTVSSNDSSGYTLTVQRTSFSPHDLPLGIGVDAGQLAAVPVAPASGLLLATANGPSAVGGDEWTTSVGFVSPLPDLPSGQYTATITFTVIGR
ncbi:MAG: lamin tail domain-containing protein [Gaiellaceae bacterium]